MRLRSQALAQSGDLKLPRPLFALRDQFMAGFSRSELRDLAFTIHIDPETIPDDTLQSFALGLARAGWCRGRLDDLLAEATRQRPHLVWSIPPLPAPPRAGCEDAPLPRPSVFRDSGQVATFLIILLAAAFASYLGLRYSARPAKMEAKFNIAVAEMNVADVGPASDNDEFGALLKDQIAELLHRDMRGAADGDVAVGSARMPVVADVGMAAALARQVDAHLVIHGSVQQIGDDRYRFAPLFFVNLGERFGDLDALNGDHALDTPYDFHRSELGGPWPRTGQTAEGAAILTHFARALAFLSTDNLPDARAEIELAVQKSEAYVAAYEAFSGQEAIYLFASHIARLQAVEAAANSAERAAHVAAATDHVRRALKIDPQYGRGRIALANIYFLDDRTLYQAEQEYKAAVALAPPGLPDPAFVAQKAHLGLGNVYLRTLQAIPDDDPQARQSMANQAAAEFEQAAALPGEPAPLQRQLAAQAIAYRGVVHQELGEAAAALDHYCAALALPLPAVVLEQVEEQLAQLGAGGQCQGE